MDVSAALRRFRLVPSVSPRAAAGYWRYEEYPITTLTGRNVLCTRNQDRVLLTISRRSGGGTLFLSPFGSVDGTSRGMMVGAIGTLPLVLDFATWGPVIGSDWYLWDSAGPSIIWAIGGIYTPGH